MCISVSFRAKRVLKSSRIILAAISQVPDVAGQHIVVEGRIFDGAGHVTKDVLVETWQANAAGRYNHPARQTG